MPRPKVVIFSTGGTIVSSAASSTQLTNYAIRDLTPEALLASVPSIRDVAEIEIVPVANIPSSCIDEATWVKLARAIDAALSRDDVAGAVVTHGTDTMEETAFFLNLVLSTRKPVVLTGSMRPASALSADGPLNLLNAVRVAACPRAADRGILITLNGVINSARSTMKSNSISVETFRAPEYGALGFVVGDEVEFVTRVEKPHTAETEFSPDEFASGAPRVDIVLAHAGDDGLFVRAAVEAGASGIVHAGCGHGTISKKMEESLFDAAKKGVVVVRASRTPTGPVLRSLDRWSDAGFIPAGTLSPQKARVLLQLALAKYPGDAREAARIFRTY